MNHNEHQFSVPQVRSHGDSKVTVSYRYIIQDELRSSLESNLVQEDAVLYDWALKKWSHCSKPCGGGTHSPTFQLLFTRVQMALNLMVVFITGTLFDLIVSLLGNIWGINGGSIDMI